MPDNTSSKTLGLITDTTFYPIYFKQKFEGLYHISPLSSKEFEIKDLKFLFADVIVIDDQFFGDGIFRLLTEIRRMSHYQDKPIIIITGKLRKTHIDRLIKAGANDFIREPIEDQDVLDRLKDVEKYQVMSAKLHSIAGKMTPLPISEGSLKNRFLMNRDALAPIQKSIKEGGYLVAMSASIDQEHRLCDISYEEITNFIKMSIRKDDIFFAIGGGKFIVFFDNTSSKKGFMIAESLKDDVSSRSFRTNTGEEKFTLSIGLAPQKKPPYIDVKEMINDARNAATRAKEMGNQVIVHS